MSSRIVSPGNSLSRDNYIHSDHSDIILWHQGSIGATAILAAADILSGFGLVIGRSTTIDKLRIVTSVAGGAGSVCRLGLYKAKSDRNIYPGARIVDSGEIDCTAAAGSLPSAALATPIQPGLYWLVSHFKTAVPMPTVYCAINNNMNLVGPDSSVYGYALYLGTAYAALPDPFPAGAAMSGTQRPIVGVKFS
jgi:hypothetical protein